MLRGWSKDELSCGRVYGVRVRVECVCARVERVGVYGFECGVRVYGLGEVCECRMFMSVEFK